MRSFEALGCVVIVALAVGAAGCRKKQASIQNHVGPVAVQAAKPPAPAHAVPIPNVHAISELEREKAAYVASARAQLDDIQKQSAPLQATMARTAGAARVEYAKLLTDVAAKRAAFQADLASIQNASQDSWPGLRTKADHDLIALRGSMQAAATRIGAARTARKS